MCSIFTVFHRHLRLPAKLTIQSATLTTGVHFAVAISIPECHHFHTSQP